ncbi:hypothetical protein CLS_26890 [[Clostridium] cf. saccharolyticum K10]|nr:hypothetical protein CLS_26890 [[Clostridium] cf. saccharolyticum K10]
MFPEKLQKFFQTD